MKMSAIGLKSKYRFVHQIMAHGQSGLILTILIVVYWKQNGENLEQGIVQVSYRTRANRPPTAQWSSSLGRG